jgi:hypothetical protein
MVLALALGALITAGGAHADWRPAWWTAAFGSPAAEPLPVETVAQRMQSGPAFAHARLLAAAATPEGHWRLINRAGEQMTTASAEELRGALERLAPATEKENAGLVFVLAEPTVFAQADMLKELPSSAKLHAMIGETLYPLTRSPGSDRARLYAHVQPDLAVEITDRHAFDEVLAQLSRPYTRHRLRLVALEPGTTDSIRVTPATDKASGALLTDRIDPVHLQAGLSGLRGQTVIVSGHVVGDLLHIQPSAGPETTVQLDVLRAAAKASDVDLVVLHASSARQPGTRNWLWLKTEIAELKTALDSRTFADFARTLGGAHPLVVSAPEETALRTHFEVRARDVSKHMPLAGPITDMVSEVTGRLSVAAVEVDARSTARAAELARRIVPGVPWIAQVVYLSALVLGLVGIAVLRRWWRRLWPTESRAEYGSVVGFLAAKVARGLAFGLIFVPLAGPFGVAAGLAGLIRRAICTMAGLEPSARQPAAAQPPGGGAGGSA